MFSFKITLADGTVEYRHRTNEELVWVEYGAWAISVECEGYSDI